MIEEPDGRLDHLPDHFRRNQSGLGKRSKAGDLCVSSKSAWNAQLTDHTEDIEKEGTLEPQALG